LVAVQQTLNACVQQHNKTSRHKQASWSITQLFKTHEPVRHSIHCRYSMPYGCFPPVNIYNYIQSSAVFQTNFLQKQPLQQQAEKLRHGSIRAAMVLCATERLFTQVLP
jgi:hypothetical protein